MNLKKLKCKLRGGHTWMLTPHKRVCRNCGLGSGGQWEEQIRRVRKDPHYLPLVGMEDPEISWMKESPPSIRRKMKR